MKHLRILSLGFAFGMIATISAQTRTATLSLEFSKNSGPIEIDRISLGQGGLSPDSMWDSRIAEIRALHPRLIRLFVQEYFNILLPNGQYHFDTLDQSVDEIVKAGAQPLMTIASKPKLLYPKIDQDIVDPTDYSKWQALIAHIVEHYKSRGLHGLYWEISNEGDIGASGGSPYRFTPENYTRYYRYTAEAILKADPSARVGGPALAGYRSRMLPALLDFCEKNKVPLHFVSWHAYVNDPKEIQETIRYVQSLLVQHPSIHAETFLDEWNMALSAPPTDSRLQPAFVVETAWRMKESGLSYSCYYHIRDYHVERDIFTPFFAPEDATFMANWWNRMPQYDGLFDYQNVMRPAYFSFKLLSRLGGDRLEVNSNDDHVHAFLSHDKTYGIYSLLFWNFSDKPVSIKLDAENLPQALTAHRRMLDAEAPSNDENVRLRALSDLTLSPASKTKEVTLEPYGIESWYLEPAHGK